MRRFLIPGTYVIDEDIQVSSGLVLYKLGGSPSIEIINEDE